MKGTCLVSIRKIIFDPAKHKEFFQSIFYRQPFHISYPLLHCLNSCITNTHERPIAHLYVFLGGNISLPKGLYTEPFNHHLDGKDGLRKDKDQHFRREFERDRETDKGRGAKEGSLHIVITI